MKFNNLLASFTAVMLLTAGVHGQNLKPGTVTFKNIHGSVVSHNENTGATEEITTESLLTEGFIIETQADGYLDIVFSNGVVGRLSPNSKVTIESFATYGNGGRNDRQDRMKLDGARNQASSTTSNLGILVECGDLIVNATEKEEGDLTVRTPTTDIKSDLTKFFVSHGNSNAVNKSVSRAINLGAMPIVVSSRMSNAFTDSNDKVAYGYYDAYAEPQKTTLNGETSAVVISENESASQSQTENQSDLTQPKLATDSWNTQDSADEDTCDKAQYGLLPYDPCLVDRLGSIADHALYGGNDPMGAVLVTAAAPGASYENQISQEVGEIKLGMMLPEGTIIRSSDGPVAAVFPNGAILNVEPASNVFLESVSSHPVLSDPTVESQTNILIRVETGRIVANTLGTPPLDTFAVISPLDRHSVASNTVVSVEFLQMDTNAFQTVSRNRTPDGASGVNTVVVTSNNLSFVSDNVTFIEYAVNGNRFAFTTPPSYTHITESAIIPPGYDFIDRTIAFAAAALPGPITIGTPGNPGNVQRFTDEEDPVSP